MTNSEEYCLIVNRQKVIFKAFPPYPDAWWMLYREETPKNYALIPKTYTIDQIISEAKVFLENGKGRVERIFHGGCVRVKITECVSFSRRDHQGNIEHFGPRSDAMDDYEGMKYFQE